MRKDFIKKVAVVGVIGCVALGNIISTYAEMTIASDTKASPYGTIKGRVTWEDDANGKPNYIFGATTQIPKKAPVVYSKVEVLNYKTGKNLKTKSSTDKNTTWGYVDASVPMQSIEYKVYGTHEVRGKDSTVLYTKGHIDLR